MPSDVAGSATARGSLGSLTTPEFMAKLQNEIMSQQIWLSKSVNEVHICSADINLRGSGGSQ